MRVGISNLAWDIDEDGAVATLLASCKVDAIDIIPSKYFSDPVKATKRDITFVRNWWSERGIEITGMQALLFGKTDFNIFGSPSSQDAMLHYLEAICRIGEGLGATRLVFGSPKNRDRTGLSDEETIDQGVHFFERLGDIASNYGVLICLEANPSCYGANFMLNNAETARMVKLINHSSIRMQFDTGILTINEENPLVVLQNHSSLIEHIHLSEPNLLPLGDGETDHIQIAKALTKYLPHHTVSIEMLATKNEPHEVSIKRALHTAMSYYRTNE
jgi:sugar phosphate isomerase/epimerase